MNRLDELEQVVRGTHFACSADGGGREREEGHTEHTATHTQKFRAARENSKKLPVSRKAGHTIFSISQRNISFRLLSVSRQYLALEAIVFVGLEMSKEPSSSPESSSTTGPDCKIGSDCGSSVIEPAPYCEWNLNFDGVRREQLEGRLSPISLTFKSQTLESGAPIGSSPEKHKGIR